MGSGGGLCFRIVSRNPPHQQVHSRSCWKLLASFKMRGQGRDISFNIRSAWPSSQTGKRLAATADRTTRRAKQPLRRCGRLPAEGCMCWVPTFGIVPRREFVRVATAMARKSCQDRRPPNGRGSCNAYVHKRHFGRKGPQRQSQQRDPPGSRRSSRVPTTRTEPLRKQTNGNASPCCRGAGQLLSFQLPQTSCGTSASPTGVREVSHSLELGTDADPSA